MELITKKMNIDFQSLKPRVKIISTRTKLKTREIPVTNNKTFFKQFQYTNNTGNMFPYIIHPRISSEMNLNEKAIKHRHKIPLEHVTRKEPCTECGSLVNIVDEIHGELLCPQCGIVVHQIAV